uniref:Signal recognition particle 9 kDa protein n=1 Tax=Mus spicilegus TaxID=10103 RepID=A0A8C6G5L1_MUSSI
MLQFQTWEDFSRGAEKHYLEDPIKIQVALKYRHVDGNLCIKVTDVTMETERMV